MKNKQNKKYTSKTQHKTIRAHAKKKTRHAMRFPSCCTLSTDYFHPMKWKPEHVYECGDNVSFDVQRHEISDPIYIRIPREIRPERNGLVVMPRSQNLKNC